MKQDFSNSTLVLCFECQSIFTLQTLPAKDEQHYGQLVQTGGFSFHAATSYREIFADSHQAAKLERLCRYIARPVVCEQRLSMTNVGKVRYELKTPYRDGTQVTAHLTSFSHHWI